MFALVAAVVTDSLGRKWNDALHPRGRDGKFIRVSKLVHLFAGKDSSEPWGAGEVTSITDEGHINVKITSVLDQNLANAYVGKNFDFPQSNLASVNEKAKLKSDSDLTPPAIDQAELNYFIANTLKDSLSDNEEKAVDNFFAGKPFQNNGDAGLFIALYYNSLDTDTDGKSSPEIYDALERLGVPADVVDDTPDAMAGIQYLAQHSNNHYNTPTQEQAPTLYDQEHGKAIRQRMHDDGTYDVWWVDGVRDQNYTAPVKAELDESEPSDESNEPAKSSDFNAAGVEAIADSIPPTLKGVLIEVFDPTGVEATDTQLKSYRNTRFALDDAIIAHNGGEIAIRDKAIERAKYLLGNAGQPGQDKLAELQAALDNIDINPAAEKIDNGDGSVTYTDKKLRGGKQNLPTNEYGVVDAKNWEKIGPQAGSNQGGVYDDKLTPKRYNNPLYQNATGDVWYVKQGDTANHAANEVVASQLYSEAGIKTPELLLADTPFGGIGTASLIIPDLKQNLSEKLVLNDQDYKKKLCEGFVVDAWLANWDVKGLSDDNILTDKNGDPVRVDAGGALYYRAQGAKKGSAFSGTEIVELETFKSSGYSASKLYDGITPEEELASAQRVVDITPERIDQIVDAAFASPDTDQSIAQEIKQKLKSRRQIVADTYDLQLPEIADPDNKDNANQLPVDNVTDDDASSLPNSAFEQQNAQGPLADWEKELLYGADDTENKSNDPALYKQMVDAQGPYRYDVNGNKLRIGQKVTLKDGSEATIDSFKGTINEAVLIDANGKKRFRKLHLIFPVEESKTDVDIDPDNTSSDFRDLALGAQQGSVKDAIDYQFENMETAPQHDLLIGDEEGPYYIRLRNDPDQGITAVYLKNSNTEKQVGTVFIVNGPDEIDNAVEDMFATLYSAQIGGKQNQSSDVYTNDQKKFDILSNAIDTAEQYGTVETVYGDTNTKVDIEPDPDGGGYLILQVRDSNTNAAIGSAIAIDPTLDYKSELQEFVQSWIAADTPDTGVNTPSNAIDSSSSVDDVYTWVVSNQMLVDQELIDLPNGNKITHSADLEQYVILNNIGDVVDAINDYEFHNNTVKAKQFLSQGVNQPPNAQASPLAVSEQLDTFINLITSDPNGTDIPVALGYTADVDYDSASGYVFIDIHDSTGVGIKSYSLASDSHDQYLDELNELKSNLYDMLNQQSGSQDSKSEPAPNSPLAQILDMPKSSLPPVGQIEMQALQDKLQTLMQQVQQEGGTNQQTGADLLLIRNETDKLDTKYDTPETLAFYAAVHKFYKKFKTDEGTLDWDGTVKPIDQSTVPQLNGEQSYHYGDIDAATSKFVADIASQESDELPSMSHVKIADDLGLFYNKEEDNFWLEGSAAGENEYSPLEGPDSLTLNTQFAGSVLDLQSDLIAAIKDATSDSNAGNPWANNNGPGTDPFGNVVDPAATVSELNGQYSYYYGDVQKGANKFAVDLINPKNIPDSIASVVLADGAVLSYNPHKNFFFLSGSDAEDEYYPLKNSQGNDLTWEELRYGMNNMTPDAFSKIVADATKSHKATPPPIASITQSDETDAVVHDFLMDVDTLPEGAQIKVGDSLTLTYQKKAGNASLSEKEPNGGTKYHGSIDINQAKYNPNLLIEHINNYAFPGWDAQSNAAPEVKTVQGNPNSNFKDSSGIGLSAGDSVTSTDGKFSGTIVSFLTEKGAPAAKVQGEDGKTRIRRLNKLNYQSGVTTQVQTTDPDSPYYGQEKPAPPALTLPAAPTGPFVSPAWLDKMKAFYASKYPGQKLEDLQYYSSYQKHMDQGDIPWFETQVQKGFVPQDLAQEAIDEINAKNAGYKVQIDEYNSKLLAYNQEVKKWAQANGFQDENDPALFTLKGFTTGIPTTFAWSKDPQNGNDAGKNWGNQNYGTAFTSTLTSAEKSAIKTYTGSGYGGINGALHNMKPGELHKLTSTMKNLDSAIDKAPRFEQDTLIVRSDYLTSFIDPKTGSPTDANTIFNIAGTVQKNQGFMSATPGYVPGFGEYKDVWIRLRIPKGHKGMWVSQSGSAGSSLSGQGPGEREVLMPRGMHYYVHEVKKEDVGYSGTRTVVEVEVVPEGWTPGGAAPQASVHNPTQPGSQTSNNPVLIEDIEDKLGYNVVPDGQLHTLANGIMVQKTSGNLYAYTPSGAFLVTPAGIIGLTESEYNDDPDVKALIDAVANYSQP